MFKEDESSLRQDVKALNAFHTLHMICEYWNRNHGVGHTKAAVSVDQTKAVYLVWSPEERKYLEYMLWSNGRDPVKVITAQEAIKWPHKITDMHRVPLVVDHYVIQRLVADIEPLFTYKSPSLLLASVMTAIQALSAENERLRAEIKMNKE